MDTKGTEITLKEEVTPTGETTPKVETPTAEEQLKTLTTQLNTLTTENEKLQKQYKGLQGTVNEKAEQIRKQANIDSRIDALQDSMELLATAIVSGARTEEDIASIPPDRRQDVVTQLRQKREEAANRKKQEAFNERANAIYGEAEKSTDDIDALASVRQLIRQGDFDLAEKKVGKLKPKETMENKETEEERIKRLVAEGIQAERQSKGLLKTDNVVPSGASKQWKQIRDAYVANPNDRNTRDEYLKARRERGL